MWEYDPIGGYGLTFLARPRIGACNHTREQQGPTPGFLHYGYATCLFINRWFIVWKSPSFNDQFNFMLQVIIGDNKWTKII